jgi:hypothetical protein
LGEAALLNSENVARVLDVVIRSLQGLRDDIADGSREDVSERLEMALEGRRRWLGERVQADWSNTRGKLDVTNVPTFWERLVGARKPSNKEK